MSGTFQMKGVRTSPFFLVYFSVNVASTGRGWAASSVASQQHTTKQQTCMSPLISSPVALCVCFESRSEVQKPPSTLWSLSSLCQFNSQTKASAHFSQALPKYVQVRQAWLLNDNVSRALPKYVHLFDRRRRKPFGKETTTIPAQICSVWRHLAFHIDNGRLSTVPPTLLHR